jgi:transcriptional regulator with XRE-family HTH domain
MANTASEALFSRRLGRKLRTYRERAGKTQEEIGATPGLPSTTTIYNLETGRAATVKVGTILVLARFYGLSRAEEDELLELAEVIGQRVTDQLGVSKQLGWYADLERTASRIHVFEPILVHGLLQTPEYARAVISSDESLPESTIESRVAFRVDRQEAAFSRKPEVDFAFILGEGALALQVGSPDVMSGQIEHLVRLSKRIDIRYRPFRMGPHQAMNSPYVILEFTDPDDPSVIYTESHAGLKYISQEDRVTDYKSIFGRLRSQSVPMEEYTP